MHSWLKIAGASVLVLGLFGCTEEPSTEGTAVITLTPSPRFIDDKGQSTSLKVTTLDAAGKAGTGDLVLSTPSGLFGNDQKSVTLTLDAEGKGTTTFRCPVAQDTGCKGFVRIEGAWDQITNGTSIQVTASTSGTDAGTGGGTGGTDAGTGGGTGGTDAGTGGATDAGTGAVGVPSNIVFLAASAKPQIGIRSTGLDISTPLTFVVTDLAGSFLSGAEVTFAVTGPAGVSLQAIKPITNAKGEATVLLQSGDEVGIATVTARVTGTSLSVSTAGTPIVGARVSDEGLVVTCEQINLAANASETPPRIDLTTPCTAKLVDRFKNPITMGTSVTWYSEAGSIQSPMTGTNSVTSTFSTAGKWPPVPVNPLVTPVSEENEPFVGTYNPRDMLVTVIAVTSGEEEFYDGSGLSNGVKNGKWDSGEWFVDMPEPFVDSNDNQVYDLGEQFIDAERVDCATGLRQPKNGKWDGPNGCWDGDVMLWRPTHIVYSGFNTREPARWTLLAGTLPPPYTVPKGGITTVDVTVTDAYLNRMAPTGADIVVESLGSRGTVELPWVDSFINSRTYGFHIVHERVEVIPDSGQPRGYAVVGLCDPGKVPPAGASTDPKLARCVRQYRFGKFGFDNIASIGLKGVDPADTKPAQTIPAFLTAKNGQSSATYFFDVTFQ